MANRPDEQWNVCGKVDMLVILGFTCMVLLALARALKNKTRGVVFCFFVGPTLPWTSRETVFLINFNYFQEINF